MTEQELVRELSGGAGILMKKLSAKIGDPTGNALGDIYGLLISMRRRIEQLEARPTVKYCGVWNREEGYREGHLVTDGGSVWHCNVASKGIKPGDGKCWTLAVKRGADGKDARR